MKKKVLILGASKYCVRSIISAKEIGCEVIVTDRNPEAEGFKFADRYEVVDITNIEGSIEVAKKYRVDGVVAINDFGVITASAIASELGLVGIGEDTARYTTNKGLMRQKWWKDGIPSPRFRVVETFDEILCAVEELGGFPLIMKPSDLGSASRGVSRIDKAEELESAFDFAKRYTSNKDKHIVIEEFVVGSEHSMEMIIYDGEKHIIAVSDKVKVPFPYRVDKSVTYPTNLSPDKLESVCEIAKRSVESLGINIGAVHVELCVTDRGPVLFELGARCGGGGTPDPIVPFLTGVEMFKEIIRIAIGEEPHNLKPLYTKGCVYRFITPKPGKIKKIEGLDEVKKWPGILDCEIFVKTGDEVNPVKTGNDRSGFIIAGANNRMDAIELADRAEVNIKFEYEF